MTRKLKFAILLFLAFDTEALLSQSDSGGVDLSTLDAAQLAKVPAATLQQGVQQLSAQDAQDSKLCKQLVTFNNAMCTRLTQLGTQCVTQAYLIPPTTDPLGCSATLPPNPTLQVVAKNLKGYTFRIRANKHYISDAFGEGGGTITFHRDDNQPVVSPRFREIISMTLVSVTPNSTITSNGYINSAQIIAPADLTYLTTNMQLRITINNTSVIDTPDKQWLILQAPADATVKTEVAIDPEDILKMGKNANCVVSPSEIDKIRSDTEASAASSAHVGDCP